MNKDIYSNEFVTQLFDSLAKTYDRVNAFSSFGFSTRWRKQFIDKVTIKPDSHLLDLMCGMGECWETAFKVSGNTAKITGIDISGEMIELAIEKNKEKHFFNQLTICCEDIFVGSLTDNSYDVIISGFGLKTLTPANLQKLANLVYAKLKPGGSFSFIEMSVPPSPFIKVFYMFYLKNMLPLVGKIFLGNPENYRMLGVYTENFKNCSQCAEAFERTNLTVIKSSYFFGCATGVYGYKPT